jgi:hypothetical protein
MFWAVGEIRQIFESEISVLQYKFGSKLIRRSMPIRIMQRQTKSVVFFTKFPTKKEPNEKEKLCNVNFLLPYYNSTVTEYKSLIRSLYNVL